jgi:hypothetical protein
MTSHQPGNSANDNLKFYLEYLDKEMTIMGILSTFCVLTLGFVAQRLFSAETNPLYKFWEKATILCVFGLSGFLLAALSFYRQRSLLAWYYGQLSLNKAKGDDDEVNKLLKDSDGWFNWKWYQTGFGFLALAFMELGAVCLSSIYPFVSEYRVVIGCSILLLCFICNRFTVVAYSKYPYEDNPLRTLWKSMFKGW